MAALDHANQTGNYSVLRDLGSPGFQQSQSAATLANVFTAIRNSRVDLGNTLVVEPRYEIAPTIQRDGMLRMRGSFPLRPTAIGFDMLFQNISGQWRLFGIAVVPLTVTSAPRR